MQLPWITQWHKRPDFAVNNFPLSHTGARLAAGFKLTMVVLDVGRENRWTAFLGLCSPAATSFMSRALHLNEQRGQRGRRTGTELVDSSSAGVHDLPPATSPTLPQRRPEAVWGQGTCVCSVGGTEDKLWNWEYLSSSPRCTGYGLWDLTKYSHLWPFFIHYKENKKAWQWVWALRVSTFQDCCEN